VDIGEKGNGVDSESKNMPVLKKRVEIAGLMVTVTR
jgi:hypothetical protein